jgi:hypothetical protein
MSVSHPDAKNVVNAGLVKNKEGLKLIVPLQNVKIDEIIGFESLISKTHLT